MEASGLIIHPFIKVEKIDTLLASLLPEYANRPKLADIRPLAKRARRRAVNRHLVIPGLTIAALFLLLNFLLLQPFLSADIWFVIVVVFALIYLFCFGWSLASALLWYKQSGYSYNNNMLMICNGGLGKVISYLPRRKIQWAKTSQNPLQRLAKVSSIEARTAAGIGGTTTQLRDIPADEALSYLDWARPRAAANAKIPTAV
jgi:putative membrane protein